MPSFIEISLAVEEGLEDIHYTELQVLYIGFTDTKITIKIAFFPFNNRLTMQLQNYSSAIIL